MGYEMKITITHKKTTIQVENNFNYTSYIDAKDFVLQTIAKSIQVINKKEKDEKTKNAHH